MEGAGNNSEKRRNPRIVRNFMIRYRRYVPEEYVNWETSIIQNISESGCCFSSNIPYPIGQILELEVQLPSSKVPVQFLGEVKRCENRVATYDIGMEFTKIDEAHRKDFVETVKFFLSRYSR